MSDFEKFLNRHGEVATLALIENIERAQGIPHNSHEFLANRWMRLAEQATDKQNQAA